MAGESRPRWPIYIPTKGRWLTTKTANALRAMRVPFRMIVEPQEHDAYAAAVGADNLLVLDQRHVDEHDPCCNLEPGASKGSGPARNLAWDHAASVGAEWHWCMDDNIGGFLNWNRNAKVWAGDGTVLRAMEAFVERFSNVAMAGPAYEFFVMRREKRAPFTLNTRVYSCNLIRTACPFRWRARWNEDTDLSLRMLKAGWVTVLFNAFLQKKQSAGGTRMSGGNTDELYADGTLRKSRMIAMLHPDVAQVTWRFNRWHHVVDYSGFKQLPVLAGGATLDAGCDGMGRVVRVQLGTEYGHDWRGRVIGGDEDAQD